jgi:bidirectional [NiFe] hydrogenase diaphorase subunit
MPGLQPWSIVDSIQAASQVEIQAADQVVGQQDPGQLDPSPKDGASNQVLRASDQALKTADQALDALFAEDLKGQGTNQDGLIEILNRDQAIVGYLKPTHLRQIARHLKLPASRVWGVASFYHLFHFEPPPKHSCLICTGTACYVKGAGQMLKQLQGDGPAQLLERRGVELGTVRCIGTCGGAPLAVIDGRVCNHQSAQTVLGSLGEPATLAGQEP